MICVYCGSDDVGVLTDTSKYGAHTECSGCGARGPKTTSANAVAIHKKLSAELHKNFIYVYSPTHERVIETVTDITT